jgi:sulfhydrogenase subunit gamma (sulfur reductase)
MRRMASSSAAVERSVYLPTQGRIASIEDLTPSERLFTVVLPGRAELGAKPGQFVQVSLPGFGEAPISVASSVTRPESFQLAVRRAGTFTTRMHALEPGDEIARVTPGYGGVSSSNGEQ